MGRDIILGLAVVGLIVLVWLQSRFNHEHARQSNATIEELARALQASTNSRPDTALCQTVDKALLQLAGCNQDLMELSGSVVEDYRTLRAVNGQIAAAEAHLERLRIQAGQGPSIPKASRNGEREIIGGRYSDAKIPEPVGSPV